MKKLSGGSALDCGHYQVVSYLRQAIASNGLEQNPVWCVECNDWTRLAPAQVDWEKYAAELQAQSIPPDEVK